MLPHFQYKLNKEAQHEAQKLNEHGSYCIETCQYERAIDALIRGLHLADFSLDVNNACACESCTLDNCLNYSHIIQATHGDSVYCSEAGSDGFLYRQPIHIPSSTISEGHMMGMTLPLILTFNLALAYHLTAITGPEVDRKCLQRVLQLYELAYRWQMNEVMADSYEKCSVSSLSFIMVIANNLGQIHYCVNNMSKYRLCLQHLLSTVMFVVDCRQVHSTPNSAASFELEGFFQNASRLILQEQAAPAA